MFIVRVKFDEIENEMVISHIVCLRQVNTDVELQLVYAGPEGSFYLPSAESNALELNPGEFFWEKGCCGAGSVGSCKFPQENCSYCAAI